MYPLPPVEFTDVDGDSNMAMNMDMNMEIPKLEDPEPVTPGKSRGSKRFAAFSISRRNGMLLGISLVAVVATWAALNLPIQDVLPDNWQAQLKALNAKDGIAGNGS